MRPSKQRRIFSQETKDVLELNADNMPPDTFGQGACYLLKQGGGEQIPWEVATLDNLFINGCFPMTCSIFHGLQRCTLTSPSFPLPQIKSLVCLEICKVDLILSTGGNNICLLLQCCSLLRLIARGSISKPLLVLCPEMYVSLALSYLLRLT